MIGSAIAFNRQDIAPQILGILNGNINEVTSSSYLRLYHVVSVSQCLDHFKLERRVRCFTGLACDFQFACLGILEEILQGPDAPGSIGVEFKLFGLEVAKHAHRKFSPGDQNVQAAVAALPVYWAEFLGDTA
ncbi:hypothetical protein D3C79_945040 [compost metagenome]